MSERVGNVFHIEQEPPGECELCGEIAELRPYGPGGKEICFPCGMKDEAEVERQMAKRFGSVDLVTVALPGIPQGRKQ